MITMEIGINLVSAATVVVHESEPRWISMQKYVLCCSSFLLPRDETKKVRRKQQNEIKNENDDAECTHNTFHFQLLVQYLRAAFATLYRPYAVDR